MKGGIIIISKSTIFILLYLLNLFIIVYSIYQLIDNLLFFNKEGSKLKIKKSLISKKGVGPIEKK